MADEIVVHLDMNSYFASVEQQLNPELRGRPIGILGKGEGERTIMISASIEAKALGVKGVMPTWEARRVCPEIFFLPASYDRYLSNSQRLFTILETFTPQVEIFSIDEAFLAFPRHLGYEQVASIATEIKRKIFEQLGLWLRCSVGISYGKIIAKLAAERQKLDGLTVIKEEDFSRIAHPLRVDELSGIGRKLAIRLERMGVQTIGDLAKTPQERLVFVFGESLGSWLSRISRGIDNDRVRPFRDLEIEKSISHAYTLPQDTFSREILGGFLRVLSERVGTRLRRKKLSARSVAINLGYSNRTSWGQSQTLNRYINSGEEIYQQASTILAKKPLNFSVRSVSVTAARLISEAQTPQPLFQEAQQKKELWTKIDRLNARYGERTVTLGAIFDLDRSMFCLPDGRDKRISQPSDDN